MQQLTMDTPEMMVGPRSHALCDKAPVLANVILLLAFTGLLGACDSERESPVPGKPVAGSETASEQHREQNPTGKGIPWFKGSIEDAFKLAKAEKKPVFLYWGAQWCPPCQELKSTIFRRDEFIQQSKLFVPVYLDGDTERAQKYGEQFQVYGYPTVIIFDPDGVEITRIPGGMDITQYLGVLQLALNALRPVRELVASVQAGQTIRDDDWRLLASYSWSQDRDSKLGSKSGYVVLQELATACPASLAASKSKLQMLAILSWANDTERDPSLATAYAAQIETVLSDPQLARENLGVFIMGGADMVDAMPSQEQRAAIRKGIAALLAAAPRDQSIGVLTRIDAIFGWVQVERTAIGEDDALPVAQQEWVRERVDTARAQLDAYQTHAGLSAISDIYLSAGLVPEARATLLEGIETSRQPYYFMAGMADLETRAGNPDDAITWRKRAWEAAQGPATRVQWGSSYLLALLELHPDDIAAINDTGTALLRELAQQKDGLHQRSSGRIDKLSQSLLAWAAVDDTDAASLDKRAQVLGNLRGEMDKVCANLSTNAGTPASCATFLAPQA